MLRRFGAILAALAGGIIIVMSVTMVSMYRTIGDLHQQATQMHVEQASLRRHLDTIRMGMLAGYPDEGVEPPSPSFQFLSNQDPEQATGGAAQRSRQPPRKLGLMSVGTTQGVGCFQIDNTAAVSIKLDEASCNSKNCPSCFITATTINQDITLTVTKCKTARWPAGTGTTVRTGVWSYTFVNRDATRTLTVSDGSGSYKVPPQSHVHAYCASETVSGSDNRMFFPSTSVPTLTVASGFTLESGNFDASGSSGTFQTTTGLHTLGADTSISGDLTLGAGKALTVGSVGNAGATTLYGNLVVGDAGVEQGRTMQLYGDFTQSKASGGTATFTTSDGATTLGGDLTLNGNVAIAASKTFTVGTAGSGGATALYGTVQIGENANAQGKDLTLYGNLVQSDAGTTQSTLQTGTGAITLNGNVAISGTSTLTVGSAGSAGQTSLYGHLDVGASGANQGVNLKVYGDFTQTAATPGTGSFTTGTGAVALNGATTIAATKSLTLTDGDATIMGDVTVGGSAPGQGKSLKLYGDFTQEDKNSGSSTFKTAAGAHTLNGDVTISAAKSFTIGSAGNAGATKIYGTVQIGENSGTQGRALTLYGNFVQADADTTPVTFQTGSGAATVNGDVAITGTKTFTVGSAGSAGATKLYGALDVGASGNSNGVNMNLYGDFTQTAATPASGSFTTATGAHTLNGNVVISGTKQLQVGSPGSGGATALYGTVQIGASGGGVQTQIYGSFVQTAASSLDTFTTATGAHTLNGDVQIATNKNLVVGAASSTGAHQIYGALTINGDTSVATPSTFSVGGSTNIACGTTISGTDDVCVASR